MILFNKSSLITLFILTIYCCFVHAQDYKPMPEDDARWDISRCWSFYPGGWHDEYSIRMDGTDTLLYGVIYKKLILVTHHAPGTEFDSIYTNFLGGMRQADRQVFFVSEYLCIDTIERMVYDFNVVSIGDTIFTQILTNGLTDSIPHIVTALDEVLIGDEQHRRIHLTDESGFNTEYWIEGVGSSLGLTYASYWLLSDNSYDLNCFYEDDELQFTNPAPQYLFCLSPLPDSQCDSLNTAITSLENSFSFKIYPNPGNDFINIDSSIDFTEIEVYNVWGEKMITDARTDIMDIRSLTGGFYFLRVTGSSGQPLTTLKFVKM